MQCAVSHRKEKEHKNFPPMLSSQDNVHSKQHLGSLLRALRSALFLSSHTCSKNVIFQGKGMREKGREASAFWLFQLHTSTCSYSKLLLESPVCVHRCPHCYCTFAPPPSTATCHYSWAGVWFHQHLPLFLSCHSFGVEYALKSEIKVKFIQTDSQM